jgi:signal transduction histidine kinase/DNA-binding response OmpR family regulator
MLEPLTIETFIVGGGEMGARIRDFNWAGTPVGPPERWPTSLRAVLGVLLSARHPMFLWWGPDLVQFYNDGYRPSLGDDRHPVALGARGREFWAEIWPAIGPQIEAVMTRGESTWNEDHLVPISRNGRIEEVYWTYGYSPVRDDQGQVGGTLVVVQEQTARVIGERRLRTLRDLAARAASSRTEADVWDGAVAALADNPKDFPWALVYAVDDEGQSIRLAGRTPAIAEPGDVDSWPLRHVLATGEPLLVKDVRPYIGDIAGPAWPEPVQRAWLVPIYCANNPLPYGVLVAGISPRLSFNTAYQDFLKLAADHVAMAVANARTAEEERRRLESLAELDRAKINFFSNVSHELRTPLTLMLGPAEEALASPDRALRGEDLEIVYRNAKRLLKLVNTLLDFSRIEAGRAQAVYEPTDLAALTRELASAFRSTLEHAGLRFEVDCPPLPAPVTVDRAMWEKIVLNLLSNAFKFTLAGSIRVSLEWRETAVDLIVRDTGVGIPESEQERIFERFHRVQGTRGRTHEGSGIGLALVQELVKIIGGRLQLSSAVDEGSVFTVTLPTQAVPHLESGPLNSSGSTSAAAALYVEEALRWLPAASGSALREPQLSPPPEAVHILVADDNADMRDYLHRLLAARWSVETVPDGAAALAAALQRRPDLVITDAMMPMLDGFGLLRELRARDQTRNIPVIFLSARAGEEARIDGWSAGADDYLVKPFSARELMARVEAQLLKRKIRTVEELHARRLAGVFQNAPVGIAFLRGPEHVYEFANPPYLELVAGRPVLGKPIREALPELSEQGIYELLDRVYASGEPHLGRSVRLFLHRGEPGALAEVYFDFVYQPIFDDLGKVEGIAAVCFEVTDLAKARSEAEAANRTKDEFLAMLGHELRNPLAPIMTALELMRLRNVQAAEKERAIIERQVKHLLSLVDDLLDISRITRGKIKLKMQPVEIAEVVAKAIEMTSPLLEQQQHHLQVEVPAQGLLVEADANRLAQAIANLLSNAAKYTETRGTITVSAEQQDDSIVVKVRDNGIGIEPEMLPRVFDLFSQEKQALDRAQGGLGLGLAIVQSLVRLHGGEAEAASAGRGRGSEITLRLPALAFLPTATLDAEPAPAPAVSGGLRILIVDDNQDAAEMLAFALAALGHEIRTAHDGPTALSLALGFQPHIALLDIGLPVMDGYDLGRRLHSDPHLAGIRLIALTGYGMEEDLRQSQEAGFEAHMVKPVDLERLSALIMSGRS